ncbi:hypothetical protein E4O93_09035 [Diaphorobacter sp. DS2]|nr:hypothetical protein E4O93_09035 [Diaphorobacter sp. DS2]
MTNLHYIADEKLGGVEREYAEVEREPVFGDLVIYGGKVREVTYVGLTAMSLDALIHVDISAMPTLDPTGNVRIDGTVYRMVERKAAVGDKVLAIKFAGHVSSGEVMTVEIAEHSDGSIWTVSGSFFDTEIGDKYAVLEPIDQAPANNLTLTEADVRNNPRQVIDLIANLAGRLSKAESTIESITRDLGWHEMGPGRIANLRNKVGELDYDIQRIDRKIDDEVKTANDYSEEIEEQIESLDDRVSRLGTANQQAYDIVSRNVETWAQEIETIKARMGDAGRALTAEERREL